MAFTKLIAENLIIGCFSWAWIVALLFRIGTLNKWHLDEFEQLAKDHAAIMLAASLVLIYPLGAIANSISYLCAGWLFARRMNRPLLDAVGAKSLNEVYVYVLHHGSPDLVRAIESSAVPSMRISRAVVLNLLALSIVLFSWGNGQTMPFAFIALGIALLGLPVYYFTVQDWKGEIFDAYRMLHQNSPQQSKSS